MKGRLRQERTLVAAVVLTGATLGLLLGVTTRHPGHAAGAGAHAVMGAIDGSLMAALAVAWYVASSRPAVVRWMRRLSFPRAVAVNGLAYALLLVAGRGLGHLVVGTEGGDLRFFVAPGARVFFRADVLPTIVALCLVTTTALSFLFQINRLVGHNALTVFLTGRYHRPVREDRVFLFMDLASSTAIAEQIGDLRFHALVERFFEDLTVGVVETGGTIYKYVGDEMIVTWPAEEGARDANAARCFLLGQAAVQAHAAAYLADFGLVPSFRGGLHGGSVVAGELGDVKREIGYLGDVVNTTARLMDHAKEAGTPIVVSEWLTSRSPAPEGWRYEPIGTIQPRGRAGRLAVFGLLALAACTPRQDWRTPACEDDDPETCVVGSLAVDGVTRTYTATVPPAYECPGEALWPVVFGWHGSGANGDNFRDDIASFEERWAGEALFVYPDGLERDDTNGYTGWNQEAEGDDVAFFDALLDHLVTDGCADPARVNSVGHSRGGRFVRALACHRADRHVGFASIGAGRPEDWACDGPAPMWLAHGTDDHEVGYGAGKDLRDGWRDTNGCDDPGGPFYRFPRDTCTAYAGCDAPLTFCPYTDAAWRGHAIPPFAAEEVYTFFAGL